MKFEFEIGERVMDDLTQSETTIIGISFHSGRIGSNNNSYACNTVGYWVNNNWLDGARHPWEITKMSKSIKKKKETRG